MLVVLFLSVTFSSTYSRNGMKMVILLGICLNSQGMSLTNSVLSEAEDETSSDQVLSGCVLVAGCVVGCALVVGCGAGADCALADACGLVVGCGLVTGCVPVSPGLLGVV